MCGLDNCIVKQMMIYKIRISVINSRLRIKALKTLGVKTMLFVKKEVLNFLNRGVK